MANVLMVNQPTFMKMMQLFAVVLLLLIKPIDIGTQNKSKTKFQLPWRAAL
jgi:hypothetical protein